MLSPVATARKVEEKKCKTFPIRVLEVIYELSSEAHASDIQAFLSIQNVLYFKIVGWLWKKGILLHMVPEHHMAKSLLFYHYYQISLLISDSNTMVYQYIDPWIILSKGSWQADR